MNYLNMLTQLGIGSAHPGGYSSTLKLLDSISLKPGCSILEVGCGTGRTACLLAQKGYQVTAIDVRPEMIEKALHRNKVQQLNILRVICLKPMTQNNLDGLLAFLGFPQLLSAEEWLAVLKSQQFTDIRLSDVKLMDERVVNDEHNYPDEYQLVSGGAYSNVLLWQTSLQYTEIFDRNQGLLGSAVLAGEKPQDGE